VNQPDPTTPDPVAYFKAWLAYQAKDPQENPETPEPQTSFSPKHPSLNHHKTPV